jgi:hypothetical protein
MSSIPDLVEIHLGADGGLEVLRISHSFPSGNHLRWKKSGRLRKFLIKNKKLKKIWSAAEIFN